MRLAFIVCLFSLSLAASPSRAWAWIETAAATEPLPNPPQPSATLLSVSSFTVSDEVPGQAAVLYRLERSGGSCRWVPTSSNDSPAGTAAPLRGRVRERSVVVTRRVLSAGVRPVRGLLKARPVRGLLGGLCRRGGCG